MRQEKEFIFDEEEVFDDASFGCEDEFGEEFEEPKEWTIITALNRVLCLSEGSKLSKSFWKEAEKPLDYLTSKLGLTKIQAIFVAVLIEEAGNGMSWRKLARYFGCTRVSIMCYTEDLEDLLKKHWITKSTSFENGMHYDAFEIVNEVTKALRHNMAYVPKKIDGLDIKQFIEVMSTRLRRAVSHQRFQIANFLDTEQWLSMMCEANMQLPLCKEAIRLKQTYDIHTMSLLLLIVFDYVVYGCTQEEGIQMDTLDDVYPDDFDIEWMRSRLEDGSHELIKVEGMLEHKCVDGIANNTQYVLTRKAKDKLLEGYKPTDKNNAMKRDYSNLLISHKKIKRKEMFYNPADNAQIERIEQLLSKGNLKSIQTRLTEKGMRKGVACLFHGYPGTGKTETVLQLARKTGRDIYQIDIAGLRDKFVGESEKNIKEVFDRYRAMCKNSKVTPILFFNEADGIFGKRSTGSLNPSVEKMDNAMQNIILQEMEKLDGILIATTNLTCNLDDAFDRRFLFKVEFHKPDTEAKTKLWKSMLGDGITEEQARLFASRYDFSGGQIENIARQSTIEYIISGTNPTTDQLDSYCKSEVLTKKGQSKFVGF